MNEPGLFGNPTRTGLLLLISLIQETTISEAARVLDTSVSTVKKAADSLERTGVIAGRLVGRSRLLSLNPRFYGASELAQLLSRLSLADENLIAKAAEIRKRPRRAGKPL